MGALTAAMPEQVDAVFHVAGDVSWWRGNDERQRRTNVEGTRNVVEAALVRKARRFIHTSSVAAYGLGHAVISEQTASTAQTSAIGYLRTKWQAEIEVRKGIERGLDAVIMNPANIMGPFDSTSWGRIFRLLKDRKLPGVPPGVGSFCHVREVVGAPLEAVSKGRRGESYLLGGTEASFAELTRQMATLLGVKAPRPMPAWFIKMVGQLNQWMSLVTGKEPDITPESAELLCSRWAVDPSKAERELGFRRVPLQQMVEDSHRWLAAEHLL